MIKFVTTLFFAAALMAPATFAQQGGRGDPIVNFSSGDTVMNAAIKQARDHLPYFWQHKAAKAKDETDFSVKVAFPVNGADGMQREHIWVADVRESGKGYTAILANEPNWIAGKKLGDAVSFTSDMISDWGFYRGEKMIGFYTIRVMLPELDAREAAAIRAMLGENPQ
jgi:uncharacterized protein YegJ (DUF2314 family)